MILIGKSDIDKMILIGKSDILQQQRGHGEKKRYRVRKQQTLINLRYLHNIWRSTSVPASASNKFLSSSFNYN